MVDKVVNVAVVLEEGGRVFAAQESLLELWEVLLALEV